MKRHEGFSTRIRDECHKLGIKVVSSPFETDWQLLEAQRAGLINVIISDDGDLFVMGGDNIVSMLDYRTGRCCLYKRDDILSRPSMGSGAFAEELPALSCFLGNDYLPRLHGNGVVTVRKLMERFVECDTDGQVAMIEEMGKMRY